MFLHIGENITIFIKDIIAILDIKTVESSKTTEKFISDMIKNNYLQNNNIKEDVKTYILTCTEKTDDTENNVIKEYGLYMSKISSTTLCKRSKSIKTELEVND